MRQRDLLNTKLSLPYLLQYPGVLRGVCLSVTDVGQVRAKERSSRRDILVLVSVLTHSLQTARIAFEGTYVLVLSRWPGCHMAPIG